MLELLLQYKFTLIQMGVLLGLSAFFSSTETALFSLSRLQLIELEKSKTKTAQTILKLFNKPSQLLVTILFGNLTVNILFFSSSAVLIGAIGDGKGASFQAMAGFVVLVTVIIFGEVLPKAVGITYSLQLANFSAYPLSIWSKTAMPARVALSWIAAKLEPSSDSEQKNITSDELKMLMSISKDEGHFNFQAGEVIDDIVELSSTKAREIMRPRIDVTMCSTTTRVSEAIKLGLEHKFFLIPVYQGSENNPIGVVDVRDLFFSAPKNNVLRPYVKPIKFIPESKRVGELLDEMLREKQTIVGVVDEYGGLEGIINIDFILEEVVGKMNTHASSQQPSMVTQLGESKYRIFGELPLKDWEDFFYDDLMEDEDSIAVSTVNGFITHHLQRIPETGDTVAYKNLLFTVEEVEHNTVHSAMLEIKESNNDS